MGTWQTTCAISNLPIPGGTLVRVLLLQRNPLRGGIVDSDAWYLRAFPIRAKYDECGGAEHMRSDNEPLLDNWRRGFAEDTVGGDFTNNSFSDIVRFADAGIRVRGSIDQDRLKDDTTVGMALVREDIFSELLNDTYALSEELRFSELKRLARLAWVAYKSKRYVGKYGAPNMSTWRNWGFDKKNWVAVAMSENPSVVGFGINHAWRLLVEHEPMTDHLVSVVAETARFLDATHAIRVPLRPMQRHGPQFGEWAAHARFAKVVRNIAKQRAREQEIKDAEMRGFSEGYDAAEKKAQEKITPAAEPRSA